MSYYHPHPNHGHHPYHIGIPYQHDLCDTNIYLFSSIGQGPKGDSGSPSDSQVHEAVNDFLSDHPEYATTVMNGAVTLPKLNPDLVSIIPMVPITNEEIDEIMGL